MSVYRKENRVRRTEVAVRVEVGMESRSEKANRKQKVWEVFGSNEESVREKEKKWVGPRQG